MPHVEAGYMYCCPWRPPEPVLSGAFTAWRLGSEGLVTGIGGYMLFAAVYAVGDSLSRRCAHTVTVKRYGDKEPSARLLYAQVSS